jgi:hypothetical protein
MCRQPDGLPGAQLQNNPIAATPPRSTSARNDSRAVDPVMGSWSGWLVNEQGNVTAAQADFETAMLGQKVGGE